MWFERTGLTATIQWTERISENARHDISSDKGELGIQHFAALYYPSLILILKLALISYARIRKRIKLKFTKYLKFTDSFFNSRHYLLTIYSSLSLIACFSHQLYIDEIISIRIFQSYQYKNILFPLSSQWGITWRRHTDLNDCLSLASSVL